MESFMDQKRPDKEKPQEQQQQLKVRRDKNSCVHSSYSNVCNVAGARKEI